MRSSRSSSLPARATAPRSLRRWSRGRSSRASARACRTQRRSPFPRRLARCRRRYRLRGGSRSGMPRRRSGPATLSVPRRARRRSTRQGRLLQRAVALSAGRRPLLVAARQPRRVWLPLAAPFSEGLKVCARSCVSHSHILQLMFCLRFLILARFSTHLVISLESFRCSVIFGVSYWSSAIALVL